MEILIWCEICHEKTMHTAIKDDEGMAWRCNPCKDRQIEALKRFRHDVILPTKNKKK